MSKKESFRSFNGVQGIDWPKMGPKAGNDEIHLQYGRKLYYAPIFCLVAEI
jgi:hypothetical protein